jgi:methylated-DNA-[protein]-cysteine S-methyltransferase
MTLTVHHPTGTARLAIVRLATPAGPLTVLLTPEDGVVRAAGFCPSEDLASRLPQELRVRGGRGAAARGAVADAVAAYGDGDLAALGRVPVHQRGSEFLQRAWQAMRTVPPGSTVTYARLAALAGRPGAVRAAGSACARNLVAPFVPCHRILRSDGSLGGYAYGLDVKQRLLGHEQGR